MISDTLAEAVATIDRYTEDPIFAKCYSNPDTAQRTANVRAAMISVAVSLDAGAAFAIRGSAAAGGQ